MVSWWSYTFNTVTGVTEMLSYFYGGDTRWAPVGSDLSDVGIDTGYVQITKDGATTYTKTYTTLIESGASYAEGYIRVANGTGEAYGLASQKLVDVNAGLLDGSYVAMDSVTNFDKIDELTFSELDDATANSNAVDNYEFVADGLDGYYQFENKTAGTTSYLKAGNSAWTDANTTLYVIENQGTDTAKAGSMSSGS